MNRYTISSKDLLIFRDGRPFGEDKTFGGHSLNWPLPQTISGMCRTAIGFKRGADYFDKQKNCRAITKVSLSKILPSLIVQEKQEPLLPTPADLLFSNENGLNVNPLKFSSLPKNEFTDLPSREWCFPRVDLKGKPVSSPKFLRNNFAIRYVNDEIAATEISRYADIIDNPVEETRFHSAIDMKSHSTIDGKLYAEAGIYLAVNMSDQKGVIIGDLQIDFDLGGILPGESIPPVLYLGGERRRVDLEIATEHKYIEKPVNCQNQKYLKLILSTHGDFGGWIPDWLLPKQDIANITWVKEPYSGIEIKLRSAVVNGWEPCSGWDYEKRKPKAFRKLVKPGAVYLIELKNGEESEHLVNSLWGKSICSIDSQEMLDGYGQVIIAKTKIDL